MDLRNANFNEVSVSGEVEAFSRASPLMNSVRMQACAPEVGGLSSESDETKQFVAVSMDPALALHCRQCLWLAVWWSRGVASFNLMIGAYVSIRRHWVISRRHRGQSYEARQGVDKPSPG